jgi:hypothetical protein
MRYANARKTAFFGPKESLVQNVELQRVKKLPFLMFS